MKAWVEGPTLHPEPEGGMEGSGNTLSKESMGVAGDPQNKSESGGLESGSPQKCMAGPNLDDLQPRSQLVGRRQDIQNLDRHRHAS